RRRRRAAGRAAHPAPAQGPRVVRRSPAPAALMAADNSHQLAPASATTGSWWLYLLECGDGSWYAGISNDLDARLRVHAAGRGARYTRGRGPFTLIASRP